MALLAALTTECSAATRAYVMNGLFVGHGLAVVADRLRQRGYIVTYGSYEQNRQFAADACAHTDDRIVVIGHSFGAERAAEVATQAAACGARDVTMIGIDPSESTQVSGVTHAVNFVGELGGTIAGAQNIPVPGYSHMRIMDRQSRRAGAHPAGSAVILRLHHCRI
jgi:pimeloyl-ACP methyl ester carboxylesterase